MYSGVSNQIIQKWLQELANNDEVNPALVDYLQEMNTKGTLNKVKKLEDMITKLEVLYENEDQEAES